MAIVSNCLVISSTLKAIKALSIINVKTSVLSFIILYLNLGFNFRNLRIIFNFNIPSIDIRVPAKQQNKLASEPSYKTFICTKFMGKGAVIEQGIDNNFKYNGASYINVELSALELVNQDRNKLEANIGLNFITVDTINIPVRVIKTMKNNICFCIFSSYIINMIVSIIRTPANIIIRDGLERANEVKANIYIIGLIKFIILKK